MSLLDTLKKESEETLEEKAAAPATFDEDAIPGVVDQIFSAAIEQHASDIHFKPKEDKLEVYFRVDGSMVEHKIFEKVYLQDDSYNHL